MKVTINPNDLMMARAHYPLTQAELGVKLGTSSSTISRIERGVPIMWKNASHPKTLEADINAFIATVMKPRGIQGAKQEVMKLDPPGPVIELSNPQVDNIKEFARECQDILEEIRDGDYSEDVGQITIDIELLFSRWEVKRAGREPRKIVDLD